MKIKYFFLEIRIVHTILALSAHFSRFPRTLTAFRLHFSHTFFVLWLHFDGIFPVLFLHWIERWLTEVFREIAIWLAEKIWTGLDLNCWRSERGCKRNGRWIGYGILLIGFLIPFIVHFVSFENHFFSLLKKKANQCTSLSVSTFWVCHQILQWICSAESLLRNTTTNFTVQTPLYY